MSEKFEGVDRRKVPELTPDVLQKLEVRQDPFDHFFDTEAGISFREKITALDTVTGDDLSADLKGLLERSLEGPVVYLEMPDRYDLSGFNRNLEEWRVAREQLRQSDPVVHTMLENQRMKMASFAALQRPLFFAQIKKLGDQTELTSLNERYENIQQAIVAKEGDEERDHRTMSLNEKDALVRDASKLARDILFFVVRTIETQSA